MCTFYYYYYFAHCGHTLNYRSVPMQDRRVLWPCTVSQLGVPGTRSTLACVSNFTYYRPPGVSVTTARETTAHYTRQCPDCERRLPPPPPHTMDSWLDETVGRTATRPRREVPSSMTQSSSYAPSYSTESWRAPAPDRREQREPDRREWRAPDRRERPAADRREWRATVLHERRDPDRHGRRSPDRRGWRSPDRRGRRSPDRRGRRSPDHRGRRSPDRRQRSAPARRDQRDVTPPPTRTVGNWLNRTIGRLAMRPVYVPTEARRRAAPVDRSRTLNWPRWSDAGAPSEGDEQ